MLDTIISNTDQRGEPRFRVTDRYNDQAKSAHSADSDAVNTNCPLLKIEVFRRVEGELYLGSGRLIDISRNGARLTLSTEMPVGHSIGIRMQIEEVDLEYITAGVVCWNACIGPDAWMVGVTLAAEFPDDIFLTFVTLDLIERRQGDRSDVTIRARLADDGEDAEPLNVQMLNYSGEGCCILVPHTLEVGSPLGLEVVADGKTSMVKTEVQWCNECVIGHVVGCQFLEAGAGELVKVALMSEKSQPAKGRHDEPPELKGIISPWMWVGIAALISGVVFVLW